MDFVLNQLDEKPQRAFLVAPFERYLGEQGWHIHETKCGDRRPSPISIVTAGNFFFCSISLKREEQDC